MWFDGTWWAAVGAIGTVLAFVVAFGAILRDHRSRRKDARRAQAERISGWYVLERSSAVLLNASDQPVYGVLIRLVGIPGWAARGSIEAAGWHGSYPPVAVQVLPPGRFDVFVRAFDGGMGLQPGLEIAYSDAAGRPWFRRADGQLGSLSEAPDVHYGVAGPIDWTPAHRAPDD
jgi:hypothetical protein